MKTLSDGKLYAIIQRILALPVKEHTHNYSNGARRTYNSERLAAGTTTLNTGCVEEKFYFVQVGTSAANSSTACAIVCFDWQMLPDSGGVDIWYTMATGSGGANIEHSCITARKTSTGVQLLCQGSDKGHYIKHVCAYI